MGFLNIIPSTAPKSLTNDTFFSNYLLIVDAYSKTPKLYGMENITTAEVMDKLDMFQSIFGKLTNLAGGIWKESHQMRVRILPWQISKRNVKLAESV